MKKDTNEAKQIISLANSSGCSLAVRAEDIFVVTHWLTAYLGQQLVSWQKQEFNQPPKPMVYLIQDYEAGFYPWGSEHLLVRSTYEYKEPMIAVFNSNLLKQYFHKQNYHFDHEYSFEPKMNEALSNLRSNLKERKT
ncbi:hypothetical protein IQ257_02200 [Coleofasciculus sp. LEGE 07092]|nr:MULTISPECIES: hypothetical protein [unclassified Coleofasciculus]MBE9127388.1 hypothetical protein [Coleofasciculus sp. LEGE 07081]MBE9147346.1 hypothetical protein [Coleofasciculus sp. LEGE 07092]